jgi:hypothetical protein
VCHDPEVDQRFPKNKIDADQDRRLHDRFIWNTAAFDLVELMRQPACAGSSPVFDIRRRDFIALLGGVGLLFGAAELVRLKVNVIVAWFMPAALAAKQATREIPIVMGDVRLGSVFRGLVRTSPAGPQQAEAVSAPATSPSLKDRFEQVAEEWAALATWAEQKHCREMAGR